jgi:hypothetical protein
MMVIFISAKISSISCPCCLFGQYEKQELKEIREEDMKEMPMKRGL